MMNNDKICDQFLEIRYKSDARFFDYKGYWADAMSQKLVLPKWNMNENTAEVTDVDNFEKAFSSYHNFGYWRRNTPTDQYFPQKAVKFITEQMKLDFFNRPIYIERVGVRSRIAYEYKGSFEELKNIYMSNYVGMSQKAKDILADSNIVDTGIFLNFSDNVGKYNTNSGPMKSDQIRQFFDWLKEDDNVFDVGFYVDIDYWMVPEIEMKRDNIISAVQMFCDALNNRNQQFEKIIKA